MASRRIVIFSIFFLSSYTLPISAQQQINGKYFIRNYSPIEYNGEAQNWGFIQDSTGILYVANTGGVLAFDGSTWQKIATPQKKIPICFVETDEGRIYVAGIGFIGYFQVDQYGFIGIKTIHEKLPADENVDFIRSCKFHEGKIYFQNSDKVFVWDGKQFEIIDYPGSCYQLIQDQNQLYLASSAGLYSITGTELNRYNANWGLSNVRNIISLDENTALVATYDQGIKLWTKGNILPSPNAELNEFLALHRIQWSTLLTTGEIALATKTAGVLIINQNFKTQHRLDKLSGLQDSDIKLVFNDRQGNLWTGNNRGLSFLSYPVEYTYFDVLNEGVATVEEITKYKDQLYIGTFNGTFQIASGETSIYEDDFITRLNPIVGSRVENFALCSTDQGLLFGGAGSVSLYDGETSRILSKSIDPRKIVKSNLYPDTYYIGHIDGVTIWKIQEGSIVNETNLDLPPHEFRGIVETDNGDLWLSTIVHGVYFVDLDEHLKAESVLHFNEENGLPAIRDNLVYKVEDRIYFTTYDGIYVYDSLKKRFLKDEVLNSAIGKNDTFIYSFSYSPDYGYIWMNSLNTRETWRFEKVNDTYRNSGLNLSHLGSFQMYEIMANNDGTAWLGGTDILVHVKKRTQEKVKSESKVKIRSVLIDDDSLVYGGYGKCQDFTVPINSKTRSMRFGVSVPSGSGQNIEYSYKLSGDSEKWSSWSDENFRIYTNLSPGEYTFNVRARAGDELYSAYESFGFTIKPFWFETWWFRLFIVVVAIGSIYQIVQFFSKRKFIKKVEQLNLIRQMEKEKDEAIISEKEKGLSAMIQAQEQERQRIAKDLHDGIVQEIGSNIIRWRNLFSSPNPDKGNADQLISSLEKANQELRALSHQMMPKALETVGVVSATREMLDRSLNGTRIAHSFEFFGIEERLSEKVEIPLYRIAQELVQNVIKHSQASELIVQLYKSGDAINLIVEDNGVGIKNSANGHGIGIQNIKSRLAPLQGELNIEPSPENGTLVTVKIPL